MTTHPTLTATHIRDVALRNRLAVAPMTRVSAEPDGAATAEMADYYRAYAAYNAVRQQRLQER